MPYIVTTGGNAVRCETFDIAMEAAKDAAMQVGEPAYIAEVIGLWRPVSEPVEYVAMNANAEMRLSVAPSGVSAPDDKGIARDTGSGVVTEPLSAGAIEKVKKPKAPKVQPPNQIQEQAGAKAVVDQPDHYAQLLEEDSPSEHPPQVVVIEPETGKVMTGPWLCPSCSTRCFASQRVCACGIVRAELEIDPEIKIDGEPPAKEDRAEDILQHRVGNNDEQCPRCGSATSNALVNGWKVKICGKDNCFAGAQSREQYNHTFGDPMANEPELPKFDGTVSTKGPDWPPAPAKVDNSNLSTEADPGAKEIADALEAMGEPVAARAVRTEAGIPDEDDIQTGATYFGIWIDNPPAQWAEEPITEEGGEGGGGQLKALNAGLTDIGYGEALRHRAAVAILGQVRALGSLKELSKAEAHILLSWLEKAEAEHVAELAKVAGPQKVRI